MWINAAVCCGVYHPLTFPNGNLAGTCRSLWRFCSLPMKTEAEEGREGLGVLGAVVSAQSWRVHEGIANSQKSHL